MPGHFYDKNARRTSWPGKLMSFFYLLILIIGIVVLIKTCLIRSNLNEINKIDDNAAYIDNLCVNVFFMFIFWSISIETILKITLKKNCKKQLIISTRITQI